MRHLWLEKLFHLRHGDLSRGLLLIVYYFLIIFGFTTGLAVRATLFLNQFKTTQLPYVDMATAALVGLFVAVYIRIGRRTSLRNLLVGTLLFLATNALFFGWTVHFARWRWLYPALYIWVGVLGAVTTTQVWTLANYLLTTREAKRLFGLIGGSGILGGICSGFFTHAAAKRFGTESLLYSIALILMICPLIVILAWRKSRAPRDKTQQPQSLSHAQGPRNLRESFKLVCASPHLRTIAALVCISSLVTTMAAWQLFATAKQFIPEKDAYAAFLGSFYAYTNIISLLAQLLLTPWVLRRFGLGIALLALPSALILGAAGLLVWGTLLAAAFLKGSDKVLRYSIDKSALQLLYLPVSSRVKNQVMSFIDSVIWRFGDGLAGLTLIVFATFLHFTPSQICWISLVLLGLWLATARAAQRQYVATLTEVIQQHRRAAEQPSSPMLERSLTAILKGNLKAADAQEILQALKQLKKSPEQTENSAIRGLLEHPSPEVCQRALSVLSAREDKKVLKQVEHLLQDENVEVRAKALSFMGHHGDVDPLANLQDINAFPDFSIRSAMVAFLVRSGDPDNLETARMILDAMVKEDGVNWKETRRSAARIIGSLPDHFEAQLQALLEDADIEVESQAIAAVGKLQKQRFITHLLERLSDPRVQPVITEALAKFGDSIVGTLSDLLLNNGVRIELRRQIPGVLFRIGTPKAQRVLVESLLEEDTLLRLRILKSLNKLRHADPEMEIDSNLIETALAAEIMGHYRSYQILGILGGELERDETVARTVGESMKQELERIFRLLQLLFPRNDLHSAYFGLQSKDAVVHDNALEFLDNILKPQMRRLLVPLLDSEVSQTDRVQLANRLVGTKVETREEAVAALLHSQDPWLKSCAAYAIGTLGLNCLGEDLDRHLNDPDPMLREAVRQAKLRLAGRATAIADHH